VISLAKSSSFITIFLGIAGTSAGVGFAIPSSTVLRIVPQLIQFGKVSS
jgi:S1-C subfamily serine protease